MSKPREFWIWGFKIGNDESISQTCGVHLDKGGSEFYSPVHHVIEYSAYEKLQQENEELKKENEILRDALKFCALGIHQWDGVESMHKAREALEKVSK